MGQGTVLRIEKISPNDGQGLRTVVFLKGCPLRCAWCSTPESQCAQPDLFYKAAKCWHCARCIRECPAGALSVGEDRKTVVRDRSKCIDCHHCAEVCPSHAMGLYGEMMTVEQVMKEIRKESLFYFFSGGGVTLSGGDVLLQTDFACEILRACREECIHTMAELDMFGPYEKARKVIALLDAYYTDIKLMDSEEHRRWTGQSNETILENIRRASCEFPEKPLHVRVPLIYGVNDTRENLLSTAEFCRTLPSCVSLEFLPFHQLGSATYGYLDRVYAMKDMHRMEPDDAREQVRFLTDMNFPFAISVAG